MGRVALLLLVQAAVLVHSIQFFLRQGDEMCLSEDVINGDMIVGDYELVPAHSRVAVTVTDPANSVVYSKPSSSDGKFAYTAARDGEYRACFTNSGLHQKTVVFDLKKGPSATDYESIAKKDHLKPMEIELKRLEDMVAAVHEDLRFMQRRDKEMAATNASTHGRVVWASVFSILVLVGMGAGQVVYLKQYFQAKKIID